MDTDLPDNPIIEAVEPQQPSSRRLLLGAGLAGVATSLFPGFASRAAATVPPDTGTPDTSSSNTAPEDTAVEGEGGSDTDSTDGAGDGPDEPAPSSSEAVRRPTVADVELLTFARGVELAARDLYDAALAGSALDEATRTVFTAIRESHESYGQSVGAMIGSSGRRQSDETVISEYEAGFGAGAAADVLAAAYELEAVAIATHTDVIGQLVGTDGAAMLASVVIIEARHCTVLADLAGEDDLDTLLLSDADALEAPRG